MTKYLTIILMAGLSVAPILVSATTAEEYQAQIDALNNQINSMQQQLNNCPTPVNNGIKVIYPNGGETWEVGQTYKITWEAPNFPIDQQIKISLLTNRDNTLPVLLPEEIVIATTTNTGSYDFKVRESLGHSGIFGENKFYKVIIRIGEGDLKKSDTSDNTFKIINPDASKFLSPDGSQSWMAGKEYKIQWETNKLLSQKVYLWLVNSKQENTLISSVDITKKSYKWRIPLRQISGDYTIMMGSLNDKTNPSPIMVSKEFEIKKYSWFGSIISAFDLFKK